MIFSNCFVIIVKLYKHSYTIKYFCNIIHISIKGGLSSDINKCILKGGFSKDNMNKFKGIILISIMFIACCTGLFFLGRYYKSSSVSALNLNDSKKDEPKKAVKHKAENVNNDLNTAYDIASPPGEYKPWEINRGTSKKIAYLTFDDGPSVNNTRKILNILNQNNIKATFFLIGQNAERMPDLVRLEAEEGHSIANHTYSHPLTYRESPQIFMSDVDRCDKVLKSILGNKYLHKFMRFPGGAFGNSLMSFTQEVKANGYRYLNWNVLSGDADRPLVPTNTLIRNVEIRSMGKNIIVVLMHDAPAKTTSVEALPAIISYLRGQGYTFDKIH